MEVLKIFIEYSQRYFNNFTHGRFDESRNVRKNNAILTLYV